MKTNVVRELQPTYVERAVRNDYDGEDLSYPKIAARLGTEIIGSAAKEHFLAFYLDSMNALLSYQLIGVGTSNWCFVPIGEIVRGALLANASNIIVVHNHPSGSTIPSDEDLAVTRAIIQAAKLLELTLLDHIIVTQDSYDSIRVLDNIPEYWK